MLKPNTAGALAALVLFTSACGGGGGSTSPLPVAPATPRIIAAIGDSITAGYVDPTGVTFIADPAHAYVGVAASLLGATLVDPAAPGEPCEWMVANELPQIPVTANVVIVNCGANELRQGNPTAFRDFDDVIAATRSRAPQARIAIVDERNLVGAPGDVTPTVAQVSAWNAHEQSVATSVNAAFVDIQNDPRFYGANWPDGLHPDETGAALLGQIVAAAL